MEKHVATAIEEVHNVYNDWQCVLLNIDIHIYTFHVIIAKNLLIKVLLVGSVFHSTNSVFVEVVIFKPSHNEHFKQRLTMKIYFGYCEIYIIDLKFKKMVQTNYVYME